MYSYRCPATKLQRPIVYPKAPLKRPYQASRSLLDAIDYNPDGLSMSSIFQHAPGLRSPCKTAFMASGLSRGEQVGAPTLLNKVISPSQFLVQYNNSNSKRYDGKNI
jgi:hypothetical protein